MMKKKVFATIMTAGMVIGNIQPVLAYTSNAYDVTVPQEYMVPFADAAEGYFENGLVTGDIVNIG